MLMSVVMVGPAERETRVCVTQTSFDGGGAGVRRGGLYSSLTVQSRLRRYTKLLPVRSLDTDLVAGGR